MTQKKYIYFTLVSLFLTYGTFAQWTTEKCPTTNNLNGISLLNDKSGWIVGDNGTMLYKVKSNWLSYQKITDNNLYSVFIINSRNGWAVGAGGTILKFNGNKWEQVASPTTETLYSVSFKNAEQGIAVGSKGTIIEYDNGEWKMERERLIGNLYSACALDDFTMIGGGLECVKIPIMTALGGPDRKIVNSYYPDYVEIKGLCAIGQQEIWAVGTPGAILHYDGKKWERLQITERIPSLNSVFFSDENNGITVGYSGTIMKYMKDGWKKEVSPVNVKLNGAFISGNKYYAVGNNGTVISFEARIPDEPVSLIENKNKIMLETYPNPSSDELNIIIPDDEGFSANYISIMNIFGQIIFMKRIDPGSGDQIYKVNTSSFEEGLYLVNINSSGIKKGSGKFLVKH